MAKQNTEKTTQVFFSGILNTIAWRESNSFEKKIKDKDGVRVRAES